VLLNKETTLISQLSVSHCLGTGRIIVKRKKIILATSKKTIRNKFEVLNKSADFLT
jgi:hypothetical protein